MPPIQPISAKLTAPFPSCTSRRVLSGRISAFAVVILLPALSFAQTPREQLERPAAEVIAPVELPEMTVVADSEDSYRAEIATSASRIPEPILDTARSVQVVTREVMEDQQINDPQEAVRNVSGVQRGASRSGSGETYFVRGFRQGSLIKDGFRAGELSGGSVFTFEGPSDVANLERVEVLKGPSAILYGRGEPGGTVNYITRVPAFENHFRFEQQVGSYQFWRTELGVNWDAVPGRLALGVDAAYDYGESFIDFVEGERVFIAPSFRLALGENTYLTFRGEYINDDRSSALSVPYDNGRVVPGVPYNRYFGEPDFTKIETEAWRGLLTLEHRWNENHFTTLSLHGVQTESQGANFILFNFAGPLQDPITGDISRSAEQIDFDGEYFTARLDHVWDWAIYEGPAPAPSGKDGKAVEITEGFPAVRNQLLFSAEFDHQSTQGKRILSSHTPLNPERPRYTGFSPLPLLPFPGFPLTFLDDRSTDADAISLLLMDRLSFGETVYLSFGGRYEWFDGNSRYDYSPESGFGSANNDMSEGTFNPFVGLVVKPARNVSLYANYAESTNSFKNIGSITASGDSLDPERARQIEVGAKAEFFGGRLLTTVALFQIDKEDVAGVDATNPLFAVNAGEERSRGVEVDIAGEPIPGWRIIANYAYIDARVTDAPLGANVGNRLEGVPEHSGGFFTTYEIQQGALKGLGFGGGAFFSDRVEVDRINTGNLSGWAQADAVLYYKRDRFRVQVNVKNLFDDEFYFTQGVSTEVLRAPARTVIASVKYEF